MLADCPRCGFRFDWRAVARSWSWSHPQRGRLRCPSCGAELEPTRRSATLQVGLIVAACVATIPLLWQTLRAGMPLAAGAAVVAVLVGGTAFAAFLMLTKFRVRGSLSIRDRER